MTREAITQYLAQHKEAHVEKIRSLVQQPSVSTESKGGRQYASLLCEHYRDLGCEVARVVPGDSWPGVWGYFNAAAEHTIACYAYFDTYGVNEKEWSQPPYGASRVPMDGFPGVIVGRGATVKGSYRSWLNALEATIATEGSLPVNVLLLSEGAEMLGSPNFQRICEDASSYLETVDAFVSPRMAEGVANRNITVNLGYKNMVTFDLECSAKSWGRGPEAGTIYGNCKSVVDAPSHRLVQALASLIGADGNSIAIDGLESLNDVRKKLSDDEQALVDGLLERFAGADWSSVLPTASGVRQWAGGLEGDAVLLQYLYGPSINMSEIRTAGAGDVPPLTMLLPAAAKASVELRLVTDIPAEEIIALVRAHLDARGLGEIALTPSGVWDGHQVSQSEPIVQAALTTLEQYDRTPVIWPIQPFGGPWAGVPRQLGVPALSGCGLGHGARGGGAADEYLVIESDGRVADLVEAETFFADLLSNVAGALKPAGGD